MSEPVADIPLERFLGDHVLTGVDFDHTQIQKYGDEWEKAECIRFTIDGETFMAVEDPQDSYRSSLRNVIRCDKPCTFTFAPIIVTGRMKEVDENGNKCRTVQMFNVHGDRLVLEFGTDNCDDYYPYYVAHFHKDALT